MDAVRRMIRLFRGEPQEPLPRSDDPVGRWKRALSDFGFPFRIVSCGEAMEAFAAESARGASEGFTPIFVVPGLWTSRPAIAARRIRNARRQIGKGIDAGEGVRHLAARAAEFARDCELDPESPSWEVFDRLRPRSASPRQSGLVSLQRYDADKGAMEALPEFAIMRVPTAEHHAVPLYLDWGGWNAVPSSYHLAAIARYWQESYGARLVVVDSDTLEFSVARKPASHAEAVALLKEHYVFAPDSWELDEDTLEEAAAALRQAESWYFWWD